MTFWPKFAPIAFWIGFIALGLVTGQARSDKTGANRAARALHERVIHIPAAAPDLPR